MLTPRHLATIRAALLYWQEEMCPHGATAMRPYLEPPDADPLAADEVAQVRQALKTDVRYAVYDPIRNRLDGAEFFADYEEADLAAGGLAVASVILPLPANQAI